MADLEQPQVLAEPAVPASEVEQTPPASPEPTDVSGQGELTFKQSDLDVKVSEALANAERKWQSSKDKELQPLKDKIETLEKSSTEARLAMLEGREVTEQGDTPELRQFQTDRRQFYKDKTDQDILVARAIQTNKGINAKEIATEFGVDKDALMACDSPEAMRVTAKALAFDKAQEAKAETEKKPQKVDTGVQSVPGVDLESMSPYEKIKWGLEHPKK